MSYGYYLRLHTYSAMLFSNLRVIIIIIIIIIIKTVTTSNYVIGVIERNPSPISESTDNENRMSV